MALKGDYNDFQIPIKIIFEGETYLTTLDHSHVAPTELEYARLDDMDTKKDFLVYMAKTMDKNHWFGGSRRDRGRMGEVLKKIETIWNTCPDLRLGQLLLMVCKEQNLFMIEDEELLKLLESCMDNKVN